MTPDPAQRPRQVTLGGGLAAFGGLLLLLGLYDSLGATQSFELRRQLAETLRQPPASGLGLDVDQALSLMRVLITVTAVAAGLATVLGVFTVLGDRRARWGLLACAVVVFVASPVAGAGLLGLGVTLGTILVFSGQGRDWFAGRPVRAAPAPRGGAGSTDRAGRSAPGRGRPAERQESAGGDSVFASRGAPGGAPGGASETAAPAVTRPDEPGASTASRATTSPTAPSQPARPRSVTEACVATWIGCGAAALVCVVLLLSTTFARDLVEARLADQPQLAGSGLSAGDVVDGLLVATVLGLVWVVAAALLALGAWRRVPATQVLLLVSAGLTVVVGLLALPVGVVNAALGVFAVVRLMRADARAWRPR